jgi:hypothetical protein
MSPQQAHNEINKLRNRFYIPHPDCPDRTLEYVDLAHVPQELQFAIDCLPLLTGILQAYPKDRVVSLLDYGPGYCAGANLFATLFRSNFLSCKVNVSAMDVKDFRSDLIAFDYPLVDFSVGDISAVPLSKRWDIVYCSNVIEHIPDPGLLISDLVSHAEEWVIIYAPYAEKELSPGHVSTITEDTFSRFDPASIEIKDSLAWEGKQILALLKGKGRENKSS